MSACPKRICRQTSSKSQTVASERCTPWVFCHGSVGGWHRSAAGGTPNIHRHVPFCWPSAFCPLPAAQDLLRHMLHPDPFNRASIDSIKRHGFLSDQVPNSLPVSALRVPPARISNSVESEPRVLFVCLEPTWATAENRSRSEAPGRWRLCSSASSMAPAVEPSQGTHQYQVLTDAKIYIMFGRPFVTASCAADW